MENTFYDSSYLEHVPHIELLFVMQDDSVHVHIIFWIRYTANIVILKNTQNFLHFFCDTYSVVSEHISRNDIYFQSCRICDGIKFMKIWWYGGRVYEYNRIM